MKNLLYLFFAVLLVSSCDSDDDPILVSKIKADYKVVVEFNWDKSVFPDNFPANAHFSKIVALTHKANYGVFKVGSIASAGIKKMAETGDTSPLDTEIDKLIETKYAEYKVLAGGLSKTGKGKIEFTINISSDFHYVSFVNMIAPSPDWFVGVNSMDLLENGKFIESKIMNLKSYDAGTDSGDKFTSENLATDPVAKISILSDKGFGDGENNKPYIAKVTFTKM